MKHLLTTITTILIAAFSITSCQKEGGWTFDYPQETLCGGTWNGAAVYIDDHWVDITSPMFSNLQFSIRFNTDGTYYGRGYFGNGSGTYKASGKTITTYVDGELFYTYTVKTMTGNEAELTMASATGSSIDIRVRKD